MTSLQRLGAQVPQATQDKFERLEKDLVNRLHDGLIVAFSGGVDSAFLLWAAKRSQTVAGGRLLALTAVSPSMAQVERDDARRFALAHGVEHAWEESTELENPAYQVNDGTRCYHCKTELFRIAKNSAKREGYRWLAYGYNASDRGDVRPGHKAAQENDVLAPLDSAGLTKDDIRTLMRAHGLELSEKPASPCLSSRLMTGVAVTAEKLGVVEAMEKILRDAGTGVFRVRLHEEGATRFFRIETSAEEMTTALSVREELTRFAKENGYRWVTLDLAGYKTGGATDHARP